MIWAALMRAGTVLSVFTAAIHLYDQHHREVKPNRIYTSREAARFLAMDRKSVVKLIKANTIRGKLVRGNYRIFGQSIIEYLNQ